MFHGERGHTVHKTSSSSSHPEWPGDYVLYCGELGASDWTLDDPTEGTYLKSESIAGTGSAPIDDNSYALRGIRLSDGTIGK
jgi:hypothetical protein